MLFDRQSTTSIPYLREVEGRLLTFYQVEPKGNLAVEFIDVETSSRWNMLGIAVNGPLQGERLRQLPAYNAMWFAWSTYWPEKSCGAAKASSRRQRSRPSEKGPSLTETLKSHLLTKLERGGHDAQCASSPLGVDRPVGLV